MIPKAILGGAVLSLLLVAACSKAADDQARATTAQAEADEKIVAARAESDRKAVAAQTEANHEIAEAQASFDRRREDYRHKTTLGLVALDRKVDRLANKVQSTSGKTQSDLVISLHEVRVSREAFMTDYATLDAASPTTWDATSARLDREWTALEALVDGA